MNKARAYQALLLGFLALGSTAAYADQPRCDIRLLSLSEQQKLQLRDIRLQYRNNRSSAYEVQPVTQNLRRSAMSLFNQSEFNESIARHYAGEKYARYVQREVDELRLQHEFYQILTAPQKQVWLRNCLE